MNIRHLPLLLATGLLTLAVGCASVAAPEPIPVSTATTPSERLSIGWWKARLAEKEAQAKTQHDTVFIGDSITHNWDNIAPDLQKQYFGDVLNLGFSGDKTQEVLWRIARIDWQTVAPKRIMLMIGTNNTGHGAGEKPENTFNGIKAIVRQLRASCPEAKITLLKIFPRGANGQDPKRKLNDAINALFSNSILLPESTVVILCALRAEIQRVAKPRGHFCIEFCTEGKTVEDILGTLVKKTFSVKVTS